jgi:hypothetical protein
LGVSNCSVEIVINSVSGLCFGSWGVMWFFCELNMMHIQPKIESKHSSGNMRNEIGLLRFRIKLMLGGLPYKTFEHAYV